MIKSSRNIIIDCNYKCSYCWFHSVSFLAWPQYIEKIPYFKNFFEFRGYKFEVLTFWGEYNGKKYPEDYTEEEKKIIGLSLSSRDGETFQTKSFSPYRKLCNSGLLMV